MKMTVKERKELNKFFKEVIELCDKMDGILDGMEEHPNTTHDGPKVLINKEHYA